MTTAEAERQHLVGLSVEQISERHQLCPSRLYVLSRRSVRPQDVAGGGRTLTDESVVDEPATNLLPVPHGTDVLIQHHSTHTLSLVQCSVVSHSLNHVRRITTFAERATTTSDKYITRKTKSNNHRTVSKIFFSNSRRCAYRQIEAIANQSATSWTVR